MSAAGLVSGLLGLCTLACAVRGTEPGQPVPDDSPVQTDALSYTLVHGGGLYDARATATYTNRSGAPLYYARCTQASTGVMFTLRRTGPDSARKAFIGVAWACVGGVPTGTIAPGAQVTVDVWLGSTDSPDASPPIQLADRIGRFRIVLLLCRKPEADSDLCLPVPVAFSQSNAFEVKAPGS